MTSAALLVVLGRAAVADPGTVGMRMRTDGEVAGEVPEEAGDEGAYDEVERPPTGTFQVGAGFATDDGFIFSAGVGNTNLFGRGQTLALTSRISQRRQLFLLHFEEPHLGDTDLALGVDVYNQAVEWPGFTRRGAGAALTLAHPIGEHMRAFASYRVEDVTMEADVPAAPPVEPGQLDVSTMMRGGVLSAVRTGVIYDTRDTPFFPRRGTSATAWVESADRRIGSDANLARFGASVGHHQPVGPFTLHLGGGIEGVTSPDALGVPLSERLQIDGSADVRGYAPGALGSVDPVTGVPLGGNLKMTARGELEFPLVPKIGLSGTVFADAGAVIDLEGRAGDDFGRSVGVGLLWRSPIGPLSLGVAMPMEGGPPAFIFGIGGSF